MRPDAKNGQLFLQNIYAEIDKSLSMYINNLYAFEIYGINHQKSSKEPDFRNHFSWNLALKFQLAKYTTKYSMTT